MKTSFYCIPIEDGNRTILFDSMSKSFIQLRTDRFKEIYSNSMFLLNKLSEEEKTLLIKNGFLLEDSIDQQAVIITGKHHARLQKNSYHMIINPTLDCNLSCWYCYESHIANSRLNDELVEAICKHIEFKYKEDSIKFLHLSFFGGEPLIASKEICTILNFACSFCSKFDIELNIHFTTNGTIISNKVLDLLKGIKTTFQITLDGNSTKHNLIRCFKKNGRGTFDLICKNIKRTLDLLPNAQIILRINYDEETLLHSGDLLDFIATLETKRVSISLHKVWQISKESIDTEKLFDLIFQIRELGFNIDIQGYPIHMNTCYADCLNACIINYNGDVYKCSARDFKEANSCGKLNKHGIIVWNYDKLKEYCFCQIPSKCKECVLLPCCPGICSQQVIENGDSSLCIMDKRTTIEEVVLLRYYLTTKK